MKNSLSLNVFADTVKTSFLMAQRIIIRPKEVDKSQSENVEICTARHRTTACVHDANYYTPPSFFCQNIDIGPTT